MELGFAKQQVLGYLGAVLEPVIRLVLRTGITWREFADLAKVKFVDVATADFGIRGRPTNASRVAILTGLDRRDVRKLRKATPEPVVQGYQSKGSQVLAAWHHDAEFLDAAGEPAALPVDGEGASFTELMRRYAPALPVVAMIKELKNADSIEQFDDGRLRALTRAYVPRGVSAERLRLWSSVLSDAATTIEYNFSRDASTPARFERRALNLKVDRKALPEFRRMLEAEGQAFLERVDDWLSAHKVETDAGDEGIRLGVGMYHIEDRVTRRPKTPKTKNEPGEPR